MNFYLQYHNVANEGLLLSDPPFSASRLAIHTRRPHVQEADGRVLLIAGGREKGGSYEPLRRMAAKKAKAILLIGEGRGSMAKALEGATEIIQVERLEEAVPLAAERAIRGDVILLSPACSSFDQFRDYKERGDLFQKLVKKL